MSHVGVIMNTVTVRALRNSFPKVLATARKKGSVGITRRGKVVATLNAQSAKKKRRRGQKLDAARLHEVA